MADNLWGGGIFLTRTVDGKKSKIIWGALIFHLI